MLTTRCSYAGCPRPGWGYGGPEPILCDAHRGELTLQLQRCLPEWIKGGYYLAVVADAPPKGGNSNV